MTAKHTKLFVIVDPQATHQIALVKALLIAKLGDCQIHAFLCVHRDMKESNQYASRKDFKHQTLIEAEQWLNQQLEPCQVAGVPFTKQVIWNSRWYDSALQAIAKSQCDLVIKSSFHHSKSKRFYRATSDYTLMRHCACPILFAHQTQEWQSNQVLACVDLESNDPQHARLNNVIIRDARAVASIVGMELNIIAAYRSEIASDSLPVKGHGPTVSAEQLADFYDVEVSRVYLRKGETIATLKGTCDEIEPSILVIGTIARTGISGKVIGNTAEKLLDLVDADLLTVN
jgi:universal stress protein E